MSAIKDLETKVQSLRDQLRAAEESLRKARLDAAPVKVGDVVEMRARWRAGAEWKGPYRVARVFIAYGAVEFTYNEKKKNGEWGARERKRYGEEWRHVEEAP